MRKLAVCLDGTWNEPCDGEEEYRETNVRRVFEALDLGDGANQLGCYVAGVGTGGPLDRLVGGCTGFGLSHNIQKAYSWLSANHREEDEIFLFGFSRGAYSARSLVGLIRNCGLLRSEHIHRIDEAYELYRKRDEGPDTSEAQVFRSAYSREVRIRFLGVWDTVGSLGIPLLFLRKLDDQTLFAFHDTRLSGIVQTACHALAIDEHREDFEATLWDPDREKPGQTIEQCWFAGAHCDVGGGYRERELADITLKWMREKAAEAGLEFLEGTEVGDVSGNYRGMCHDEWWSFKYFWRGKIRREIGKTSLGHEILDSSVAERLRDPDQDYHPRNEGLAEMMKKVDFLKPL